MVCIKITNLFYKFMKMFENFLWTNKMKNDSNEKLCFKCSTRDFHQTNHHKHIRFESESFTKDARQFIGKSYANEIAMFKLCTINHYYYCYFIMYSDMYVFLFFSFAFLNLIGFSVSILFLCYFFSLTQMRTHTHTYILY